MAKLTPMMAQYLQVKEQYQDCILMFRLGDFYEMFFDDAVTASRELEITLTGRGCGNKERAPMCGVPFHSADSYIARLVSKGYKVAICEQAEDPKTAKGLVKREIARVITPGTILDDGILTSRKMNYMCCIASVGANFALAFAEVSTGEIMTTFLPEDKACEAVISELERFSPVEIIAGADAYQNQMIQRYAKDKLKAVFYPCNEQWFVFEKAKAVLLGHFGQKAEQVLENSLITGALGALMTYLIETQKGGLSHITDISYYEVSQFMDLDTVAQRNLELVETMRDKDKRGTLLWVLDETRTSMGLRTLKKWILQPLVNPAAIEERQQAVQEFYDSIPLRTELGDSFKQVYDIERLMGKISIGTANPRDLVALKASFRSFPAVSSILNRCRSRLLCRLAEEFDTMADLCDLIERGIVDEPPFSVREGDMIKDGFDEEIDRLRCAKREGKSWLAEVEATEREATGIKNLRVGFNKVFGYYIEISNSNLDKVPDYFMRKQTLTNGERFITPRLKEIESVVLGAEEKLVALEYERFLYIRDKVNAEILRVQRAARVIGIADVLCAFSEVAQKNNYCMPTVDHSDCIEIEAGRHPVVEKMQKDSLFVPNDTYLDTKNDRVSIITGPNMAGKSTYMRQVALITIMAQIGSFVPAKSCRIGIVDKIFTRVGASDDLASGRSTFMVEMSEVASILNHATKNSLLILDEIGRGTSTYDGLSIAWAVIEYCAKKLGAKTLFATHYHELTVLEDQLEGVKNYCIAVKKRGEDIVFLRKIIRGGADQSYGIEVAKIAGVPDGIIKRAKAILEQVEGGERSAAPKAPVLDETGQMGFESLVGEAIVAELEKLDVSTISPIEAMNILYRLQQKVKEV